MFQLEPVYTRGIGYLNIIMIIIVVEFIDNAYPERVRVAKRAIVNACNVEMAGETEITFRFKNGIDIYQAFADEIPFPFIIDRFFPKRILSILIFYRSGKCKMQQVLI